MTECSVEKSMLTESGKGESDRSTLIGGNSDASVW